MIRLLAISVVLVSGCAEENIEHEPDFAHGDAAVDAGHDAGLDAGHDAGEGASCHGTLECPCGQECDARDGGTFTCLVHAPRHCVGPADCASLGPAFQCHNRGCGYSQCLIP